jgi:hypothetical protein
VMSKRVSVILSPSRVAITLIPISHCNTGIDCICWKLLASWQLPWSQSAIATALQGSGRDLRAVVQGQAHLVGRISAATFGRPLGNFARGQL